MAEAERVGFVGDMSVVMRANVKLVELSLIYIRNETFPDSRVSFGSKRGCVRIPAIETPDDGNVSSARCPNCEIGAPMIARFNNVSAELVIHPVVRALIE